LNKSILDAGWASFIEMVKHKAAWAGVTVVEVDPRKTSQICSACHKEGEHKDRSRRTHLCTYCGVVLDRDHNAAINILERGLLESIVYGIVLITLLGQGIGLRVLLPRWEQRED
jgi:putative transposase